MDKEGPAYGGLMSLLTRGVNRLFTVAASFVGLLTGFGAGLAMACILGMTLLIAFSVVRRYVFNAPLLMTEEVSGYLLVGLVFLGLGYTLKEGAHISIDTGVTRLPPRGRDLIDLMTSTVCLVLVFIFWSQTLWLTVESLKIRASAYGSVVLLPLYLPQMLMPIGFTIFGLQLLVYVSRKVKSVQESWGRQEHKEG